MTEQAAGYESPWERATDAAFACVTAYPPDRRSDQYKYMLQAIEGAAPLIEKAAEEKAERELRGALEIALMSLQDPTQDSEVRTKAKWSVEKALARDSTQPEDSR